MKNPANVKVPVIQITDITNNKTPTNSNAVFCHNSSTLFRPRGGGGGGGGGPVENKI